VRSLITLIAIIAISACDGFGTAAQPTPTLDDYKAKMRDVLTLPKVVFLDADETCQCIAVGVADPSAATAVPKLCGEHRGPSTLVQTVRTPRYGAWVSWRDGLRPIKGAAAACVQEISNSTEKLTIVGLAGAPSRGEFRHKIDRTTG